MKNILISIILFISFNVVGQDCVKKNSGAYTITISKAGKSTVKECEWISICPNVVEFRVSGTSVATFTKITAAKWEKFGTSKVINVATKDGMVIFQETEKKAYYYTL